MSNNKCRICLQLGTMTSIFEERNSHTISENIMSISKIHIYPNDGLPSTICKKCIKKLDCCLEFIQLCQDSDLKLRTNKLSLNILEEEEKSISSPKSEIGTDSETDDNVETVTYKKSQLLAVEKQIDDDGKRKQKQQCYTCGKIMSSRFRLKTHQRIHSGERPFNCPHCSKTFTLAQNLKIHLRIHTGEKPLKCGECDAAFAHTSGLTAHMRKHTGQMPYCCMLCPQRFRTFGHLQYHVRRHTGEKNFECDTCGRAFITRSQLNQHLISHSGDKPHVCCVCGLRLTRSSHLRRHMTFVHDAQRHPSEDSLSQSKSISPVKNSE